MDLLTDAFSQNETFPDESPCKFKLVSSWVQLKIELEFKIEATETHLTNLGKKRRFIHYKKMDESHYLPGIS